LKKNGLQGKILVNFLSLAVLYSVVELTPQYYGKVRGCVPVRKPVHVSTTVEC